MYKKMKGNVLIIVLVAIMVLTGGLVMWHQSNVISELRTTLKTTSDALEKANEEKNKREESNKVTEDTNEKVVEERKEDTQNVDRIRDEIMAKLRELDSRFPNKDAITELEQIRKQQEENVIRADGLWRVYCIRVQQRDPECNKNLK